MKKVLLLAALSVLAIPGCLRVSGEVLNSFEDRIGDGVTLTNATLSGSTTCKLTLISFTEKKHTLRVLSQSEKHRKGAKLMDAMVAPTNAVAACNGGYFNPPQMLPTNLEISDGNRTGTYGSSSSADSGAVLAVRGGTIELKIEKDFTLGDDITQLVQCSPMLVKNGVSVGGGGAAPTARRTFIATDGQGQWLIGITSSISLPDLADVLAKQPLVKDFKVKWAMNLDGGPSTGLWWRKADGSTGSERPGWAVRNVIAIVPRE